MSADPVAVESYLEGIEYPATRIDLTSYARERGADEQVLDELRNLPDIEFQARFEVLNHVRPR